MPNDQGTAAKPWTLKTPPGTSEFTMHRATIDGTDMLVCTVGKTVLWYEHRCLADLHAILPDGGGAVERVDGDITHRPGGNEDAGRERITTACHTDRVTPRHRTA